MDFGHIVGWIGVGCGLMVAPFQLWKIIKTGRMNDISLITYSFLCLALVSYLIHAIYIKSAVFTTAQSVNLAVNTTIWIFLMRHRFKRGEIKWANPRVIRRKLWSLARMIK